MQYELDRDNDTAGEPSIADMVQTAIEILSNDDNEAGYFLFVESTTVFMYQQCHMTVQFK